MNDALRQKSTILLYHKFDSPSVRHRNLGVKQKTSNVVEASAIHVASMLASTRAAETVMPGALFQSFLLATAAVALDTGSPPLLDPEPRSCTEPRSWCCSNRIVRAIGDSGLYADKSLELTRNGSFAASNVREKQRYLLDGEHGVGPLMRIPRLINQSVILQPSLSNCPTSILRNEHQHLRMYIHVNTSPIPNRNEYDGRGRLG
ncbi:hypothetical protein WG66_009821 [Moniliophthora roreri]|nr:hypothetical protein WG66_009821 [Moniliophthora roreri]